MSIARLRTKQRLAVGSVFLLAAALRLFGLYWGAPARIDLHPDEMVHVMRHALAISLADPDPHFLNYPSFLIYLIAILNGALTRLGWVTEPWQSYIVARAIVASFGAATAPAVFWLVTEITGSALAATLSALWVALLPLHVWESHFAVTDVVMTFWIVVALDALGAAARDGADGATTRSPAPPSAWRSPASTRRRSSSCRRWSLRCWPHGPYRCC